jgi:hypothetical protein
VKLPYHEGTWFAVPLEGGGFGIGVVARATSKGKVILCYFFGPRSNGVPALEEVERLRPRDAIQVVQIGDLALIRGKWPIIGEGASWKRSEWPMPPFVRRCELSRRAWRVQYSDVDPNKIDYEEPEPSDSALERDALLGYRAVEQLLTRLLSTPPATGQRD